MQRMVLASPAKLNLFFRILRKRSDGYHEIASLFQAIDLCDFISLEVNDEDILTSTDPNLPLDHSNLALQALILFRSRFSFPFRMRIYLDKRIPVEAGLGGGSSNAASVLWGLNEWAGRPATTRQLMEMALSLGSDVPFFFSEGTAYCTGRGEILEPFSLGGSLEGWIAKPPYGLSTSRVYQETRVEELLSRDPRQALREYPTFYNDLEDAAFRLEPRLLAFQRALCAQGFDTVTMTGSGTAFFCIGSQSANSSLIPFRAIRRSPSSWYVCNSLLRASPRFLSWQHWTSP